MKILYALYKTNVPHYEFLLYHRLSLWTASSALKKRKLTYMKLGPVVHVSITSRWLLSNCWVFFTILHPYDYSTVLWTDPSTSYSLMSHPVIVRDVSQYMAGLTTTCVFVYSHWEITCDEHNNASTAAFLFSFGFFFFLFIVLFNIVENSTCCRVLSTERPNGFLLKQIKPATHEPQILHVNKDV